jgi:phosphoribosylformimino-5-aminoimidazole carboxamide ribotide isomerase
MNPLIEKQCSVLKVIPVIDILNGKAVHAVKGMRNQYQPLQSSLCNSAEPLSVAEAFRNLGFNTLYVADFDAIIDCSTNFEVFRQINAKTGLTLLVDAGITNLERAQKLLESSVSKLIVGTETLQNKGFVAKAVQEFGNSRVLISLDLKGEKVLTRPEFDGPSDAICLLEEFKAAGVSQVIVLDLLRVGSGEGVNRDFIKKAMAVGLNVYVGGGVRNIEDLVELKNIGVSGALLATALHSGKITIKQLKENDLL